MSLVCVFVYVCDSVLKIFIPFHSFIHISTFLQYDDIYYVNFFFLGAIYLFVCVCVCDCCYWLYCTHIWFTSGSPFYYRVLNSECKNEFEKKNFFANCYIFVHMYCVFECLNVFFFCSVSFGVWIRLCSLVRFFGFVRKYFLFFLCVCGQIFKNSKSELFFISFHFECALLVIAFR